MGSVHPILNHIPEALESGVLIALGVASVMGVIRVLSGSRWAVCFAAALLMLVYASVASIPVIAIGSAAVGPIVLALCPPIVLLAALASIPRMIEGGARRRMVTAGAATLVLTGFGFAILVLPEMRAMTDPVEYRDYRLCRAHLLAIGGAFTSYAREHKNQFPRQEDLPQALMAKHEDRRGRLVPYLADLTALRCPAAGRVQLSHPAGPSRLLGDYAYVQPLRRDPPDTYVLRCRRHTRVRRFWTEEVGLYLRKDGRVDTRPLGAPR